jgi:adenylate cyclase
MSDDQTQDIQSAQSAVRVLAEKTEGILQLLAHQRDLLKQRGMALPSSTLENLQQFKLRVEQISQGLTNNLIELQRLRALAETTALINSALDTDTVLNQVMDTVINITGAERGYIVLKNRETNKFDQFRVARGLDTDVFVDKGDEPNNKQSEFIVSRTIVNEVARTGEAVLTDNASNDDRYRGQQSIVGFALRSILAVPLRVRGEVIGVVYCDNRILTGLFQQSDLRILKAFSDQATVALENARLFEEARRQLQQITEMRDLMDNVFDSIANGVITIDANDRIIAFNQSARQLIDIPEQIKPIEHKLYDMIPDMGTDFPALLASVRRDGRQRLIEVQPIVGEKGRRIWNVIVSNLRDANGKTQGLALVIDDLTEKKERESQLAELRRYLPGALVDNFQSVDDINVSGQEREITAIATDVRGFTTFSEKLPPELLMEIINRYLSLASDGINLYEGIVDKYMGDAVTGLFNTQLNPQEDHAIRAVRAAMSIIYDLYALHEVMAEEHRLFYGIGIHTGPAFLGNVGSPDRQEFAALGEATAIAKILESNAQAGEIIISEQTFALVEEYFECEARQLDKSKGYEIDTVYKVLKRKKGINTGQLFLDPELAELLADLNADIE